MPIEGPKLPEGFNVLVKELQGLGLKVDLLDHGESADASDVIEETSREIEKQQDDKVIYAQHAKETENDMDNLSDSEVSEVVDDEGIEITDEEGEEIVEEDSDLDDGTVDLGEEF